MRLLQYVKTIFILLLSILISFSCSDDDSNPTESPSRDERLIGKWSLTKVTIPALSMELTPEQAGFMMTIDVRNDDTFSMTTTDSTGVLTETGQWTTSNSTIKISYENGTVDELPYTVISESEISVTSLMEMQGMELMGDLTFRKE